MADDRWKTLKQHITTDEVHYDDKFNSHGTSKGTVLNHGTSKSTLLNLYDDMLNSHGTSKGTILNHGTSKGTILNHTNMLIQLLGSGF